MSTPLFSAVIPTYNRETYVPLAVESVLRQTCNDFEIIVVDDGSTDQTGTALRRFKDKIVCLRQPNGGVSKARNTGIAAARGKWIAFLDSDDEWLDSYFATVADLISRHGDAVGVVLNSTAVAIDGTEIDNFSDRGMEAVFSGAKEVSFARPLRTVLDYHITTLQSAAFARLAVTGGRLFDEAISIAEDLDFIAEMALRGPFVFSPALAARVVRRPEEVQNLSAQFTRATWQTRLAWSRVFERFLRDARLSESERMAVRRRYASNERALGNLHLSQSRGTEARQAYRLALNLDRSLASAVRLACSFLPFGAGRWLLHKHAGN